MANTLYPSSFESWSTPCEPSAQSALWENNCFPPIPANVTKFRQSLSQHEIEVVESLTAEFMAEYGYERMTDARLSVTRTMVEAARGLSEANKAKAWANLKHDNYQVNLRERQGNVMNRWCLSRSWLESGMFAVTGLHPALLPGQLLGQFAAKAGGTGQGPCQSTGTHGSRGGTTGRGAGGSYRCPESTTDFQVRFTVEYDFPVGYC
jgi:hypothetical protein